MYKIEISLGGDWNEESLTIECSDFNKIKVLQEFIDFQKETDWEGEYQTIDFIYDEEMEVDENGTVWFEDLDGVWYYLDEESDEFIEYDEESEEEEEEEESEEEEEDEEEEVVA